MRPSRVLLAGLIACGGGEARAVPAAPVIEAPPVHAAPASSAERAAAAPAPTASASASASAPPAEDPKPAPAVTCELPPLALLRDNITTTRMSGIAEIVASSKTGLDGRTPAPTTGYINLRYELKVVRWLSGGAGERLVLKQGAEAPGSPQAAGRLMLFSACASSDGTAYEPDVGYVFSVDPACAAELDKLADVAVKHAKASGKSKPRACEKPKG